MEKWKQAREERRRKQLEKIKWPLIVAGTLLFLALIAGMVWGQYYIPLGCAFVLGAIALICLRLSYGGTAVNVCVYSMFVVMLIVGSFMLYKGLTSGFNRQDDLNYSQSLGISAEELLATTDSEGTQYAVVMDGVISRRLLPEAYQAERAEDIGAVLVIETSYEKVGSYSNGGKAYRPELTISLKSLKTGEIVRTTTLSGDEPPTHVRISPLDPNKDRYGEMPSDQSISSACVLLIENARNEEERRNRVTLLSEDELLDFIHRMITQTAGEDGWAGVNDVQNAILDADPDFSISDYGYANLWQYYKSNPHFALNERDISDPVNYFSSQDLVRWVD